MGGILIECRTHLIMILLHLTRNSYSRPVCCPQWSIHMSFTQYGRSSIIKLHLPLLQVKQTRQINENLNPSLNFFIWGRKYPLITYNYCLHNFTVKFKGRGSENTRARCSLRPLLFCLPCCLVRFMMLNRTKQKIHLPF